MSKTVRQLDREGFYVGDAIAHGHPKRPGKYILPGGAIDAPLPPTLTEGQRARWVDDAWLVVDPDPVVTPDPPTLEEAQAAAQAQVDRAIGLTRLSFITEIPGQQMTYQAKEQEANAFFAEVVTPVDLTLYPYIEAEAAALGQTPTTVAEAYRDMAAKWREIGVTLEALRIGGKAAVQAATDITGVDAAYATFEASLASAVAAAVAAS